MDPNFNTRETSPLAPSTDAGGAFTMELLSPGQGAAPGLPSAQALVQPAVASFELVSPGPAARVAPVQAAPVAPLTNFVPHETAPVAPAKKSRVAKPGKSDPASVEEQSILGLLSLRELPSWGVSLGIHLALLLLLAGLRQAAVAHQASTVISAMDELQTDREFEDVTAVDQVGTTGELGPTFAASAGVAAAGASAADTPQKQVEEQVGEGIKGPDVNIDEKMMVGEGKDLNVAVAVTGGTGTANAGGTEGAIDRLTLELRNSLAERKTLVVWLFDASQSLRDRRNLIADRFENVYKQLNALGVDDDHGLKTVIATFGDKTNILTERPVDDVLPLVKKVREIKEDESGHENIFSAVTMVTKRFQKERSGKNMLILIVTDERGDDVQYLEETINFVRRNGVKCFVVGNAAPFGRDQGFYRWKTEDAQYLDLPVDLGPETVMAEALRLGFWNNRIPHLDRLSSGFGPYALTRLCKESGGLYFIAEEGDGPRLFDLATMRNYPPDYRPIRDYQKSLEKNKAKGALVMAAAKTKVDEIVTPRMVFRADTDGVLREEITEAQKPAALMDARINEMVSILQVGEKDREKITEPRWRASYDLAMGRAMAMRVRYFGYNTLLAEMKGLPKSFTGKGNNEWRLEPSKNISALPPAVKKLEKQASQYLKRVVDEHPGTPWATLAEVELSQPMGWEWKEAHADYVAKDKQQAAAKRIRLAEDEKKKAAEIKNGKPVQKVLPKL